MGNQKPKNHKRFVLELLQSHAGNTKGFEIDEFFIRVLEETGLSPQTIEKILTEQTGSVWKDNGRIFVIKDAFAAGFFESVLLEGESLVVSRDTGITNEHDSII